MRVTPFEAAQSIFRPSGQRVGTVALAAVGVSVALMVVAGVTGPVAPLMSFPAMPPWPPWFMHLHASPVLMSAGLWLAVLAGGGGLAAGLVAVRRGWRPSPRRLIAGSVVAVIALLVVPQVGNDDVLLYVVYGRVAVLGHSPYAKTPEQLLPPTSPIRADLRIAPRNDAPSRYGPVATGTEAAASELGGASVARSLFWLKVWNGLAFLGLVLALDRAVRSDAGRRVRVHLLWSVNPLMLFAVMASGHNDVLAAVAGVSALFALRRVESGRALAAGVLAGLAAAFKAQYALFAAGLAWAARRSPRAFVAVVLGAAAVVVPSYMLAGRAAITATTSGLASSAQPDLLWGDLARVLGWQHEFARTNLLGLAGSAVLAALLLWRMPPGPREFPAVRVTLALSLALLIGSPVQRAWYDAMIFPLLAVIPASRLDWITVARATALAMPSVPFVYNRLHPSVTAVVGRFGNDVLVTVVLAVVSAMLLWLCVTRNWNSADSRSTSPVGSTTTGAADPQPTAG